MATPKTLQNSKSSLVCVFSRFSHVYLFATPWTVAYRLLCPWDSPGKNAGVGCHALLQGIVSTQGWNPHLLLALLYENPELKLLLSPSYKLKGFHGGSEGKASACNVEDPGSIPGLGRSPGEGNGNPLQYSCLENPMDRGAWWATVHGVANGWT